MDRQITEFDNVRDRDLLEKFVLNWPDRNVRDYNFNVLWIYKRSEFICLIIIIISCL